MRPWSFTSMEACLLHLPPSFVRPFFDAWMAPARRYSQRWLVLTEVFCEHLSTAPSQPLRLLPNEGRSQATKHASKQEEEALYLYSSCVYRCRCTTVHRPDTVELRVYPLAARPMCRPFCGVMPCDVDSTFARLVLSPWVARNQLAGQPVRRSFAAAGLPDTWPVYRKFIAFSAARPYMRHKKLSALSSRVLPAAAAWSVS